jgi:hypothetical protein
MRTTPIIGPYELERDADMLRVAFRAEQELDMPAMKEMLRLMGVLDPQARAPVVLHCPAQVQVKDEVRTLVVRACRNSGRPVAIATPDLDLRLQVQVFKMVHRPAFTVRVFTNLGEAERWAREHTAQPPRPEDPLAQPSRS